MRVVILLLVCLNIGLSSFGQFTRLTTEDGLASNRVYNVQKDSKGFMWFCTDMGVCRYNGSKIETFTTKDGLADNDVFNCFEDRWGRIWFATFNGELSFFENGRFFNQENCKWLQAHKPKGFIWLFVQNSKQNSFKVFHNATLYSFWEIDSNTISMRNVSLEKVERTFPQFAIGGLRLSSVDRKFIFLYDNRIGKTMANNLLFVEEKNNKIKVLDSNASIHGSSLFIPLQGGDVLVKYKEKAFSTLRNKFVNYNFQNKDLYALLEDKDVLYLGKKNGLEVIRKRETLELLKDEHITGLAKGFTGDIYVSTYRNGVYILDKDLKKEQQKMDIPIRILTKDRKNIYFVSTDNDLYQLENNQTTKIIPAQQLLRNRLTDSIILLSLRSDTLLVMSSENKITTYNTKLNRKIKNIISPSKKGQIILRLYGGRRLLYDQYVYFLSRFWICRVPLRKKGFQNIRGFERSTMRTEPGRPRLLGIAADQNRFLGLNTFNQFFEIRGSTLKELKHLSKLKLEKFEFISHHLVGINNDNELIVVNNYTDSSSNGKNIGFRAQVVSLKVIGPNKILFNDIQKRNWLLQITDDKPLIAECIHVVKKTPLSQINSDSTDLYITQDNSTTIVPITSSVKKSWHPRVLFNGISANGVIKKNTHGHYLLSYGTRGKINLNYKTLNKHHSENLIYEYSISNNPMDTLWQETNTLNIELISLKWGTYHVLFRAKNISNHASNIISSTIIIDNPFYLSWWFIVSVLLISTGLTYGITRRFQIRKRKKEVQLKEDEKKFIQAEFKSLNALMNPHFIFNSLNNIQGFINNDSKEDANKYLEVFAQLVRQNMHNVKDGSITLEKEMNLVKNYLVLEKMRFKEKIQYELDIDEGVEIEDIFIPPLTVQPIVENSIKHGILPLKDKIGMISITIVQEHNTVHINIEDNGIGLSNLDNDTGNNMALYAIKERFIQIEKMTGNQIEFHIENKIDQGIVIGTNASISIQIPEL